MGGDDSEGVLLGGYVCILLCVHVSLWRRLTEPRPCCYTTQGVTVMGGYFMLVVECKLLLQTP